MAPGKQNIVSARQSPFTTTPQTSFTGAEHMPSLKGLLKPFKGKGDYDYYIEQLLSIREGLGQRMDQLEADFTRAPFTLLKITFRTQSVPSGTRLLRWCTREQASKMGVKYWEAVMLDPQTPAYMLDDLREFEVQRIALNMQMSQIQSMFNQAQSCRHKLNVAEMVFEQSQLVLRHR